jgi:hypothetical protein
LSCKKRIVDHLKFRVRYSRNGERKTGSGWKERKKSADQRDMIMLALLNVSFIFPVVFPFFILFFFLGWLMGVVVEINALHRMW